MVSVWLIVGFYGIFSLIGGFIGYLKASSLPSLIAGTISGIILLVCAYGISEGNHFAAWASILVSLALGIRFLKTIIKRFKVMPDLIMILLSAATIIATGSFLL
jgi:uncharacterized membrane protein (UPF0136 family)